jgi:hypothetical protein
VGAIAPSTANRTAQEEIMNDIELQALATYVHRQTARYERGDLEKPDIGAERILENELRRRSVLPKKKA